MRGGKSGNAEGSECERDYDKFEDCKAEKEDSNGEERQADMRNWTKASDFKIT